MYNCSESKVAYIGTLQILPSALALLVATTDSTYTVNNVQYILHARNQFICHMHIH